MCVGGGVRVRVRVRINDMSMWSQHDLGPWYRTRDFSRILCKLLGVLTNNHFHGAIC